MYHKNLIQLLLSSLSSTVFFILVLQFTKDIVRDSNDRFTRLTVYMYFCNTFHSICLLK